MRNDENVQLKVLITESEKRIHRHLREVQNRMTSGMIFLLLCVLFPGLAIYFVMMGIGVMLFFPFFALLARPAIKIRDHFTIKRVEKENQHFKPAVESGN